MTSWLRRVFGSATSREREERAAMLSQLTVDSEQVSVDSDKALARAERLVPDPQAERLAAVLRRTVRAVRGGG